jgi:hypothetical protein
LGTVLPTSTEMKHIIELTAKYKMGHQQFAAPVSVIARNILRVDRVPEEVPEFADGCNAVVQTSIGERFHVAEKYEAVVSLWHEALEHSL